MEAGSLGPAQDVLVATAAEAPDASGRLGAEQVLASRHLDDSGEPRQFELQHAPAEQRQTIISPPLVVVRTGEVRSSSGPSAAHLLDQTRGEHTLNRPIERAGAHAYLTVRHRFDFLRDGVAVPASIISRRRRARPASVGEG